MSKIKYSFSIIICILSFLEALSVNIVDETRKSSVSPLLAFRVSSGYECGYQQRLSKPIYPNYCANFEFLKVDNVGFYLSYAHSRSIYNNSLFGYEYSWKLSYSFIGTGVDYRMSMFPKLTLRLSASVYRKFASSRLDTENQELSQFLEKPFQRKLSFASCLALEYKITPHVQCFFEGGYQVSLLSLGVRILLYNNQK